MKTLDGGWVGGWMDGWMDGRKEAKAGLRIAYSNQKEARGRSRRGTGLHGVKWPSGQQA